MQPPAGRFENLEKASREDIINQINAHLEALNSTMADFTKPYEALSAQLLIQELAAREQRRQANIMVWCAIIITLLTAVITFVTLWEAMAPSGS